MLIFGDTFGSTMVVRGALHTIEPYNNDIRNLSVYGTIQCSALVIILYESTVSGHQTIPDALSFVFLVNAGP